MLPHPPRVQEVEAQSVNGSKPSGASVPLTMTCVRPDGDCDPLFEDYVVKLYGDLPFKGASLARELIAALLGQVFGLQIPRVAIVIVSESLCRAMSRSAWYDKLMRSRGLNFGSLLIPTYETVVRIATDQAQPAAQIFAFDMLIQNLDRNHRKPNLLQTPDGLMPYDHEKAFICAQPGMLLGKLPKPWEFSTLNPHGHLCYNELKANPVDFTGFGDCLGRLSDTVIEEIIGQVPDPWKSSEIPLIRSHIVGARDNAKKFVRSLQEVLA